MIERLPPPEAIPPAPFAAAFGDRGFVFGSRGGGASADGVAQIPCFHLSPEGR